MRGCNYFKWVDEPMNEMSSLKIEIGVQKRSLERWEKKLPTKINPQFRPTTIALHPSNYKTTLKINPQNFAKLLSNYANYLQRFQNKDTKFTNNNKQKHKFILSCMFTHNFNNINLDNPRYFWGKLI
ncbi:hypothetical protein RND81_01G081200 [Saponaria officinalis]|uniref:Uncharacterized protein n=1 Tax=Saponaria officinalis TaxID=3572 RepID=A0AAW1N6I8_SAPOF